MEKISIELSHEELHLVLTELADRSDMYRQWGKDYCSKGFALGKICDDIVSELNFNHEECIDDVE